ncbi:hypothetical protein [uncultured Desulfovibrio sp.]|uniref:hypothetical protein n=1 Tax=uncultured Desulfovibrio sp. TaxID=167968 RepID=UPI0026262DA2|nr:hypothetical protein [uncultured Desulfovibrio sp.]
MKTSTTPIIKKCARGRPCGTTPLQHIYVNAFYYNFANILHFFDYAGGVAANLQAAFPAAINDKFVASRALSIKPTVLHDVHNATILSPYMQNLSPYPGKTNAVIVFYMKFQYIVK